MRRPSVWMLIALMLSVFACSNPQAAKPTTNSAEVSQSGPSTTNNVEVAARHGINLNYIAGATDDAKKAQATSDIDALHSAGFTSVRLAIVDWGNDPEGVKVRDNHWHPVAEHALALGMVVIYGLSHNPPISKQVEDKYVSALLNEASWAQQVNNPNLVLCIGNEDGPIQEIGKHTDISANYFRNFMRQAAAKTKKVYQGPVIYSSTIYLSELRGFGNDPGWIGDSLGLGGIDFLGVNLYYADSGQFRSDLQLVSQISAKYPGRVMITEWGLEGGFSGDEKSDTTKVRDGLKQVFALKIPEFFYTYRDLNDAPGEGKHGIIDNSGHYHDAWAVLTSV